MVGWGYQDRGAPSAAPCANWWSGGCGDGNEFFPERPGRLSFLPGAGSREPGAGSHHSVLTGGLGRVSLILAALVFFTAGIWASRQYDLSVRLEPVTTAAASAASTYQPSYDRMEGEQLVLLFVGSSTCRASADPELPHGIETLKLRLAEYAEERSLGFRASAISVDWVPELGLDFLKPFGAFDEVSVGGNWTGHSLIRQTWDHGLNPVTPAVYILRRTLVVEGDSLNLDRLGLDDERVLVHRQGAQSIGRLATLAPARYLDAHLEETFVESDP